MMQHFNEAQRVKLMPKRTIWTIAAVGLALPIGAVLIIALVLFTPLPVVGGLLLLFLLDIAIVSGGYVMVHGSMAGEDKGRDVY